VTSVDTKTSDAFARILCKPTAGVSRHRQLLVLLSVPSAPPPQSAPVAPAEGEYVKPARKEASE